MTFSRHYAKARKAALKQQQQHGGDGYASLPPASPSSRQAQRVHEPVPISLKDRGLRLGRIMARLLLVLLVIAIAGALWFERAELTLPIAHINVEGQTDRIDQQSLKKILSTAAEHSMFSNLQALQGQLLGLPWVQTVQITRQWPNSLVIYFTEMAPVARFNDNLLLTQAGTLFMPPNKVNVNILPQLLGPVDKAAFLWQAYQAMNAAIQPLGLKIVQLSLSSRFSYDVILNNGLKLSLGASEVMQRLQLFAKVYQQQLAPKLDQIASVDLRYSSSMAIAYKTPVVMPIKS
jgi:cell division protein FtsQ